MFKTTSKYTFLISVFAFALLIVVNQLAIQYWLNLKKQDAKVINIAGKQRMLSQRVELKAFHYLNAPEPALKIEIQTTLQEWKQSHFALVNGDESIELKPIKEPFNRELKKLTKYISAIEKRIEKDMASAEKGILIPEEASSDSDYYLEQMDLIVSGIEKTAEKELSKTLSRSLYLIFGSLLLLFLFYIIVYNAKKSEKEKAVPLLTDQKEIREDRQILRMIIIGLSILAFLAFTALCTQRALNSEQTGLVQALELEHDLGALHAAFLKAEANQRGYLLTLDTNYIEAFHTGMLEIEPSINRISGNIALNPDHIARIERIKKLSRKKIKELTATVGFAQNGDIYSALGYTKTNFGKSIMDSLRTEIEFMNKAEKLTVVKRKKYADNLSKISSFIVIIGTLILFGIAITLYLTVLPIITQLVESRDREHLNNKLLKDKNQQLEHFAYIASHDLKEPLRTVSSFVEIFKEDYGEQFDEEGHKYLNFIQKGTTRMKALVDGLLQYSRIGKTDNFAPTNINETLSEIREDLTFLIKKNGAIIKSETLPHIVCLKTEMRQLLQNLINNAIKFSKPDVQPIVEISAVENDRNWEFCVRDNGIGIPDAYHEKIFQMLSKMHRETEYEGQGLGLAFCKKIVELHEGEIWVNSKEGEGSAFYFTISKDLKNETTVE